MKQSAKNDKPFTLTAMFWRDLGCVEKLGLEGSQVKFKIGN